MPPEESINPLTLGTSHSLLPRPCVLVIFGAAGDLAWRKLMPAVYNLNVDGLLPAHFAVVGFGIGSEGDPEEWFRRRARDGIAAFSRQPLDEGHWADLARSLSYIEGRFDDVEAYALLKAKLDEIDQKFGIPGARIFYLSIPPTMVEVSVDRLKSAGMVQPAEETTAFTRVIVEKPIGRDLESAKEVNAAVAHAFEEEQTYRIDHYLGKETVQNLMVLRFANSIFEPLWNQKYIDHVQITVAEEEGLSHYDHQTGELKASRIGYFEGIGNLRDMVQNHLLQVLCMTAMEPPWSLAPNVVRDAKSVALRCLRPMTDADVESSVVRGQYIRGEIGGREVPDYAREVTDFYQKRNQPIPNPITTETFVAMRVYIDNWRWAGVPFYLRTGKRMPKRSSEVAIQFRDVPNILFNQHPDVPIEPTILSMRIQPEEGVSLRISSKLPGPKFRIYPVKMDFNYGTSFGGSTPEAYERLILDVMAGDATLFMRRDAVEAAWEFVMPILDHWERSHIRFIPQYRAGTWGPPEADRLIEADGREWRTL
ncbi:glucose-6-phosphate dehydrogenase [Tundrisphaera lichenicola]|uniref:glucose-6-phosphate dehydrogenase n=1 Tax=Tundrisphaera lichenicola TaxID=2029860 RepID=UPI003EC02533